MITSADDMAVMTPPRADISKRNLAREGSWGRVTAWRRVTAWMRVKDPGGMWRRVERVSSCIESSSGA